MSAQPVRLSRAQSRQIDQIAIERLGIPGIVLMENAARGAAEAALRMIGGAGSVCIICGGGNNGGDGLAMARHLDAAGCRPSLLLTVDPEQLHGEARTHFDIARAMGLSIAPFGPLPACDLIVDAIFGTGLSRPPRPPFADRAAAMDAAGIPILSLDLPSGLCADAGEPLGGIAVCANRTVTFVAEKTGFSNPKSRAWTGEVEVVPIGVPRSVISAVFSPLPG